MHRIALWLLVFAIAAAPRASAQAETILRLSETATIMATPDELAGEMRAIATAPQAAEAQARVNAMIADALAKARQVASVQAATGGYAVWRNFNEKGPSSERWQASQSIELKGRDGAALLELVGTLQGAGLAVDRLDWQLAPDTARRVHEQATEQAIRGLRARAESAAALLDLAFDSFREVRLDAVRPLGPQPRAMMAAAPLAAGAAPPPSAEAAPVEVTATAEADVVLKSR